MDAPAKADRVKLSDASKSLAKLAELADKSGELQLPTKKLMQMTQG